MRRFHAHALSTTADRRRAAVALALTLAVAALLLCASSALAASTAAPRGIVNAGLVGKPAHMSMPVSPWAAKPLPVPDGTAGGPRAVVPKSATLLLHDSFEGGSSLWNVTGAPTWAATTYRASDGSWSAYCAGTWTTPPGYYYNNMNATMYTGPFNLTNATAAEFDWDMWLSSELNYDHQFAWVSVNGGATWNGIAFSGYIPWTRYYLNLGNIPGYGSVLGYSQVWVAFTFTSDSTNVYEGSYIDNVDVYATYPVVDTTPPVTTVSGWDNNWHSSPVTLTFYATDTGGSGVNHTEYRVDGASWTTGTQVTIPAPANTQHIYTVDYRSVDNAANVEAYHTCQVKIDTSPADTTPPTTTASGWDSNWHNMPVTVNFSASDNSGGSGVAYTEYQVDGGAATHSTWVTIQAPAGGGNDGTHTISYRSVDNSGNQEAWKTCTVKIDTVGPATTATSVTVKRYHTATFRFSVSDSLSPQIKWKVTVKTLLGANKGGFHSAGWVSDANPYWVAKVPITLKKGTYRYYVCASDLAGNTQRSLGSAKLKVK